MGKMRRLLAAVLVASMLFGTNGVSYAAETIADGASQETTVEETTDAATEEVTEPEKQDDVTETAAAEENTSGSEQDEQDAVEPASADMAADTTDEAASAKVCRKVVFTVSCTAVLALPVIFGAMAFFLPFS